MTNKAIIDLQVNDSSFSAFLERFKEYQDALKELPESWRQSDRFVEESGSRIGKLYELVERQNELIERMAESAKKPAEEARSIGEAWDAIYTRSRSFYSNVERATLSLMKWTSLTSVFSGLLGAGGLYGIDRMALGVSARRSSAMGVGASYGARASFLTNFGRLGNADGILHAFNEAQHDVTSVPLHALGVAGRVHGMSAADAFAEALPEIKKLVDQTDPRQLQNVIQGRGLNQIGIDLQTASIIKNMSPAEIQEMIQNYRKDAGTMNVSDDAARKWADFSAQMERAGVRITTVLERNLVNVTPGLLKLSKAFVDVATTLLSHGGPIKDFLKTVSDGMESFADGIGSDTSQSKVSKFLHNFSLARSDFDSAYNAFLALQAKMPAWMKRFYLGHDELVKHYDDPSHERASSVLGRMRGASGRNDTLSPGAGIQLKPGATLPSGKVVAGLHDLEDATQGIPGGRVRISAENDEMHHHVPYHSKHVEGLAFDQTIRDKSQSDAAAEYMRRKIREAGLADKDFRVIDEYRHPSGHATGGHIHTQFNSQEAANKYHEWANHPAKSAQKAPAKVTVIDNSQGSSSVQVAH